MRHFIFSCPLAQVVWREFQVVFGLPEPVTLQQAVFSWSPQTFVLGKRFGFKLQAGHAVALHVLWLAHCGAVYNGRAASTHAVKAHFRALLFRHVETLWASTPPNERDSFVDRWTPPLSDSILLNFVHI
jgi:hypothetical protein